MKKYYLICVTTVKEYFVYRLNFILWRLRAFINLIIIFFLWDSVLESKTHFLNYQRGELLTYIIFSNLIANFVLGTRTTDIANEINQGKIINYLLKPLSFFKYYLSKDLVDKTINLVFALLEISLLIFLFNSPFIIQKDLTTFPLFLIFLTIGSLISFYINILLSLIAFWTTQVWGPRFIFLVVINFISGSYFPLDLLPQPIFKLILLTPFPYLYYIPTMIYIKKSLFSWRIIFPGLFWLLFFLLITKIVWNKGLRNFSFYGR